MSKIDAKVERLRQDANGVADRQVSLKALCIICSRHLWLTIEAVQECTSAQLATATGVITVLCVGQ